MKKVVSVILFILMISVFIFEIYVGISGGIAVKRQLDELAAREASGHEYLGVGLDVLVFDLIILSAVGGTLSLLSWKFGQYQVIRIVSAVTCALFLFPIFMFGAIMTL